LKNKMKIFDVIEFLAVTTYVFSFMTCASNPPPPGGLTPDQTIQQANVSLDQAVQTSVQAIETRLPKGAKAAVLTFTSASQTFSDYIIDEIATDLSASRNIQVIGRQHTDAIRKESIFSFQAMTR
jgi:hypothetical protein